jgi:F-type H+-transporting ATPase subunit a
MMLDELVHGAVGSSESRVYTPLVGSLFIYILTTNFLGLCPLQNSSTGYITTTAALGLVTFLYVQWIALKKNGFFGYLYHLAGSPNDIFGFILAPVFFPLHIVGEFTKPITLMFRLYGNIMAGHILVAAFLGMGVQALKPFAIPVGIPMHLPFLFLEVLVSVIQAFVFALLTAVYIGLVLPHEEHTGGDDHHDEYLDDYEPAELAAESAHEPVHG